MTAQGATIAADAERTRRFRDLVMPYLDDVYSLARHFLRNEADAEDAVQECYLRAFRHFDSYRGPAAKPWLLTILRNVCYSEFARKRKSEIPEDVSDFEESVELGMWSEPEQTPESALMRQERAETIRELIAALPVAFREVIVLREINDLSYQEIANVTGVPVGTVMSRLARARAALRTAWNKADFPAGDRAGATDGAVTGHALLQGNRVE
jgi:RNA polymerase sigma-70 factor (ECF subfamily)